MKPLTKLIRVDSVIGTGKSIQRQSLAIAEVDENLSQQLSMHRNQVRRTNTL